MAKRPEFTAILEARLSRRTLMTGAASAAGLAACARIPTRSDAPPARSAFQGIAPRNSDEFVVADGYRHKIIARWGDSLVTGTPDFDTRVLTDTTWLTAEAAEAQNRRFGTNADAVQYFPLSSGRAARGLICVNNEYFNSELVFAGHAGTGMKYDARKAWMEKHPHAVKFMQAAHGVSVLELHRDRDGWNRAPSKYSRRITANTPMDIHGPARGHALLRTNADPGGTRVFGTFANCSAGKTPWGTYLTSEENVDDYFANGRTWREKHASKAWVAADRRFPLRERSFYGWEHQDPRFDTLAEPNEFFRFGWMVEIDPHDPTSIPRKRTTLGRFQHEGANTIVGRSGHVAAYMGDDEKFEYVYKFVSRDPFDPKNPRANRDLLDHGTLYAARFDADGTGEWLPLVHDEKGPLNSGAGFGDQGDVLIQTRYAADLLGATTMDRPEDVEPSPITGRVYVACTKSEDRGVTENREWFGREAAVGVNPANPRADNRSGHIIEIAEDGDDVRATRFTWNVFLLAGKPSEGRYLLDARELAAGVPGPQDTWFAGYANAAEQTEIHCPDNLGIDPQGRLWIVTDGEADNGRPNNGCFVMETQGARRGLVKQLASGPNGCEISGCEFTPDGRTLFLSIQHPGEGGSLARAISHWPDGNGLPARAAVVAVEREDGAPV
jgi:secreted PhoX family phosphatase